MTDAKIESLDIDIETYSSSDLLKCGVYKYTESADFDILLFGYSVNEGERKEVDLARGEKIPEEILDALSDEAVEKWAHNVSFERICLSAWLRKNRPDKFRGYGKSGDTVSCYLNPRGWRCSMVWVAYMGLPLSLEGVGAVLGMGLQKLSEGKDLVRYFSIPCKPTKVNGGRTRNLPEHAPDKWDRYKAYNIRDVEVEMEIRERLQSFPVPDSVWEEYWLDQQINDRGVVIDTSFVSSAISMDEKSKAGLMKDMERLTGLENPNSNVQLKRWLEESGMRVKSLEKDEVARMLKTAPPEQAEVLMLHQGLSRPSIKKYATMMDVACADGRVRGVFRFYGAHTGRWTSRQIQLQNLPRNTLSDLEQSRSLVCSGDYDALEAFCGDVPDTLSQLVRTAFVPRDGCKFIVADFSTIEVRVLAWLANETWRLKAFEDGVDIYCASASQMFHVPVEKNGVNGGLRQRGKVADLALGYGGSTGALISNKALENGLTEEELPSLVATWRESNPSIIKFWKDVEGSAMRTIQAWTRTEVAGLCFSYQDGALFITLPSGRKLSYIKPRVGKNRWGQDCMTYEGVNKFGKWARQDTYGGKLTENIVQAVSRDILANAIQNLSDRAVVMHVHDELVVEVGLQTSVDEITGQMERMPAWAKGLKMKADGFETPFYKKE